jgi:hypothetical protein
VVTANVNVIDVNVATKTKSHKNMCSKKKNHKKPKVLQILKRRRNSRKQW